MKKLFLLLMTTCFLSVSALAERVVTGQVVYVDGGILACLGKAANEE